MLPPLVPRQHWGILIQGDDKTLKYIWTKYLFYKNSTRVAMFYHMAVLDHTGADYFPVTTNTMVYYFLYSLFEWKLDMPFRNTHLTLTL